MARGRPDGDAPRRAQPGEPRQPARGRQEREALVVRQPAVRLVPGEAPGPPVPAGASRTTTRRSARWTTSTPRRSRTSAPSSGPTTRRTTRSCRSSATSRPRTSCAAAERYFGAIPPNPDIPPLGDLSLPPTLGGERRETVFDKVPLPRVHVGFRAPVFGDPRLDALDLAGQILSGGKGSRLNRRLVRDERIAQDVAIFTLGFIGGASITAGWATVRPGVPVARVEAALHEELERLATELVSDDELARAKALTEADELGRAPARRGAGRPPVDVRHAVRRPGADQPDAAALPGGHPRGDPRRGGGRLPAGQPAGPDVPARGHDRGRRGALARGRRADEPRTDEEVAA